MADTWNNRIDVFDANEHYLRSLPVQGWESHDLEDKPYLALSPNGDILVTQPKTDRILELNQNGAIARSFNALGNATGSKALARPIGIATDAAGMVYITDGANNQVIREPLAALP